MPPISFRELSKFIRISAPGVLGGLVGSNISDPVASPEEDVPATVFSFAERSKIF